MNDPSDRVREAAKGISQAIDSLARCPGVIPTDLTMQLLYALKRLSQNLYERGTVSVANLSHADTLRRFKESLSEIKEAL